jgi:hypothetical protein
MRFIQLHFKIAKNKKVLIIWILDVLTGIETRFLKVYGLLGKPDSKKARPENACK